MAEDGRHWRSRRRPRPEGFGRSTGLTKLSSAIKIGERCLAWRTPSIVASLDAGPGTLRSAVSLRTSINVPHVVAAPALVLNGIWGRYNTGQLVLVQSVL